jgi:hypothetical protein
METDSLLNGGQKSSVRGVNDEAGQKDSGPWLIRAVRVTQYGILPADNQNIIGVKPVVKLHSTL